MAGFNLTATLQQALGTNSITAEIIVSIILFIGVAIVGWAIYFIFNRYFSKWAKKTETSLDDDIINAVKSFIVIAIIIIGIEFALSPLSFLQPYAMDMNGIILVIEILLTAFALTRVSNVIADWYLITLQVKDKIKITSYSSLKKSFNSSYSSQHYLSYYGLKKSI